MRLKKWPSNSLEKFRSLYSENLRCDLVVTMTCRWPIRELKLTWVLSLKLLQIGENMRLKKWPSNNLEKCKSLYSENLRCDLVVTMTWRWPVRDLKLTWVLSLRLLQIGGNMWMKKWPSNNIEKFRSLDSENLRCDLVVTMTWRWPVRELKLTWVLSLRLLQIGGDMWLKKWPSNNIEKFRSLYSVNLRCGLIVTMTWRWPLLVLKHS
jgi:hypothetical protein